MSKITSEINVCSGQRACARVIAFYLPQFHPIPENDLWWGKGFTEWANVAKARPLFKGHYQPHLPRDLGFYDLRVPEVREQQAELARGAGIEGFCYWHYWFGNGKRALERVFSEVVESGKPDFPFCLAWANESWTGRWHGLDSQIIIEQTYPGIDDYCEHFETLLPAFKDPRYIEVEGRKLFVIYRPELVPDLDAFCECWNNLASQNGMKEFFFLSANTFHNHRKHQAISGVIPRHIERAISKLPGLGSREWFGNVVWRLRANSVWLPEIMGAAPLRCNYSDFVDAWNSGDLEEDEYPCVYPNWDNTPRCGSKGSVLLSSTPDLFGKLISAELQKVKCRVSDRRIVFIKSWNEWAEGNYLEPDQQFGSQYLDALRRVLLGGG